MGYHVDGETYEGTIISPFPISTALEFDISNY